VTKTFWLKRAFANAYLFMFYIRMLSAAPSIYCPVLKWAQNAEFDIMWKETVASTFAYPRGTEETQERARSIRPVTGPSFERGTRSRGTNHTTVTFSVVVRGILFISVIELEWRSLGSLWLSVSYSKCICVFQWVTVNVPGVPVTFSELQ
jgi:hypothetical protein